MNEINTDKINLQKILKAGSELSDIVLESSMADAGNSTFLRDYLSMLTSEKGSFGKQNLAIKEFESESVESLNEMNELALNSNESSIKVSEMENSFGEFQFEIDELKKSRKRLDEIIEQLKISLNAIQMQLKAIHDINTHTHLLSINASIEAARAGEAGVGFRIIANEVKRLSESTNSSTKSIEENIETFTFRLNSLMDENNSSTKVLDKIKKITGDAKNLLSEIARQSSENAESTRESVEKIERNNQKLISISKEVEKENIEQIQEIADKTVMNTLNLNDRVALLLEIKSIFQKLIQE